MSPRATTPPSAASITNTLRLLCTSRPTYDSIGLPSSLSLGRIATPWSAVDLTAAEGSPPSSIRFWNGLSGPTRRAPGPRSPRPSVLSDAKQHEVLVLGRLGWPLRRIEE